MKILLFTDTLGDLNGVSRFIQDMGELASRSNINLRIATSTSKTLPDKDYIVNLPYRFKVPMPFYQELDLVWSNKAKITELITEFQPDIVHISTPGPFGWAAKSIAQKLGYPLIGTYHTDFPAYIRDLTGSNWLKRRTDKIMHQFYASFEHVFSRSEQYLEIMAHDLKLGYEKTSVIYPGTNLNKFNPQHFNEAVWHDFGLANNRLKVLYVGRINIEKNIPFLTEIWKDLLARFPHIKADLIMVGEGRYRKWADRLRKHHAYFLGPVVDQPLSNLYASSDYFVFPSVTDTLGQVIMETQASGVPCMVSDIGGPQTLVVEGITGIVVTADDHQAWVTALEIALTDIQNRTMNERVNNENEVCHACVEHMQQYDIETSFTHFMAKHQEVHAKVRH